MRSPLVAVVVVALVVACSSPSRPPASANVSRAATDDPRAYLLGHGVPRDYRKAAALYAARCREGCGDIAACEAYLDLGFQQRGTPINETMFAVAARLCDRKLPKACVSAIMAGVRGEEALEGVPEGRETAARCDRGDLLACRTELRIDVGLSDGTSYQNRRRHLEETVCLDGNDVPACIASVNSMFRTCMFDGPYRGDRGQPCIDARIAWYAEHQLDATTTKQIWAKVQAACADGDADACDLVPGKEIDAHARCEAGDYGVCNKLAEAGNAKAAAVACAGGVTERCVPPVPSHGFGDALSLRELCEEGQKASCETLAELTPTRCP